MTTKQKKQERIEIRVKPGDKKLLENAAELTGLSVSTFMLNHTLKAAKSEIDSSLKIKLSNNDRNLFMKTLENPPKPNKTLKKAILNYQNKY